MRKFLKKFLFLPAVILILVLSGCSSCDFLLNNLEQTEEEQPATNERLAVDVNLKNSLDFTDGISFKGASRASDPYGSVADTIEKTNVNRASVAIFVTVEDGVICGSGTIVDIDDGVDNGSKEDNIFYVITCQHVIDIGELYSHEAKISVPDKNGRNYDDSEYDQSYSFSGKIGGAVDQSQAVSLVGADKSSDIALLRLYVSDDAVASNIVKAKVISTDYSVRLGEDVFAIGNSRGMHGGWTSAGVVSDVKCVEEIQGVGDMTLLGINVDIYQGNSGGGLFNLYGELVAVTNAGETITDAYGTSVSIGINFAIPHVADSDAKKDTGFINVVKQLLGTYLDSGKNYGYVSGRVDNFWFTFSADGGKVIVTSVIPSSQATGELSEGDVINGYSVNEGEYKAITTRDELKSALNSLGIGDSITLSVTRVTDSGQTGNYNKTFTATQYYFCNTGDYTNVKA